MADSITVISWLRSLFRRAASSVDGPPPEAYEPRAKRRKLDAAKGTPTPPMRAVSKLGSDPTMTEVLHEVIEQLGGPQVELDREAWAGLALRIVGLAETVPPPSFPRIATEIVEVARDPDVDVNQLVGLVQRDAAIAATLLRVANSVAFSPAVPITNLRGAIQMMGIQLVIEVALGASARSYYEVASKAELALFPGLWQSMFEEAMANAFTCGRVALDVPNGRPERALVAGLLADVGRPIALRILARLVREGLPMPSAEIVTATLDEVAARIGEQALLRMELPPELLEGCIPTGETPTADSMIARLVSASAAIQRRSPRIWGNAADVRAAADQMKLSPHFVRTLFAQRDQYLMQAKGMFGTMRA